MASFLVDESVHGDVARGAIRREPTLDIVRVQDAGLSGADDAAILDWAAAAGRIVLTSDVSTLVGFAYERVRAGRTMPGVFVIRQGASLGQAIEDILLAARASLYGEWDGQVVYLPF